MLPKTLDAAFACKYCCTPVGPYGVVFVTHTCVGFVWFSAEGGTYKFGFGIAEFSLDIKIAIFVALAYICFVSWFVLPPTTATVRVLLLCTIILLCAVERAYLIDCFVIDLMLSCSCSYHNRRAMQCTGTNGVGHSGLLQTLTLRRCYHIINAACVLRYCLLCVHGSRTTTAVLRVELYCCCRCAIRVHFIPRTCTYMSISVYIRVVSHP